MKRSIGYTPFWMEHQADVEFTQANPVSTTLYTVLSTTFARIISIDTKIIWAVTQPNPLETLVLIDGVQLIFIQANPVNGSEYLATLVPYNASATQGMRVAAGNYSDVDKPFLFEGRSVLIQCRVTWAVTQPTPMSCRVKWSRCR